jgi:hypothetical protein
MNSVGVTLISLALGAAAGSLSGYFLLNDITRNTIPNPFKQILSSLLRIVGLGVIGWRLLHWGPLPFILFGVSLLITMWVVIITFNSQLS